jgi:hypothetical protein
MSKATGKEFERLVYHIVGGVWVPKHPDYVIESNNGTLLEIKGSNFRKWFHDWNWNHLFGWYDRLILVDRHHFFFDLDTSGKDSIRCNPWKMSDEMRRCWCTPEDLFNRYYLPM